MDLASTIPISLFLSGFWKPWPGQCNQPAEASLPPVFSFARRDQYRQRHDPDFAFLPQASIRGM